MKKIYRHAARENAVLAIYQWLLCARPHRDLAIFLKSKKTIAQDPESLDYAFQILDGVIRRYDQDKKLLSGYLREDWSFERLSVLEQAILLTSCFEILEEKLDKRIVIDEAVKMAKKYCDEDSYRFINGILTNIG